MRQLSKVAVFLGKRLPRGYFRILKFAASHDPSLRDYEIKLLGLQGSLRADLREPSFIPLFRDGQYAYQSGNANLTKRLLQKGGLVFDVGANVGFNALLYSELVGDRGKVIALEPSPKCHKLLSRSLSAYCNIEILCVGASDSRGVLPFYETTMLATSSLEQIHGIDPYEVKTQPLDDLLDVYGMPDFVKIDVEGHEEKVFQGMRRILSEGQPTIVFESLDNSKLRSSLEFVSSVRGDYRSYNIRNDGTLGPVSARETHDFLLVKPDLACQLEAIFKQQESDGRCQ